MLRISCMLIHNSSGMKFAAKVIIFHVVCVWEHNLPSDSSIA